MNILKDVLLELFSMFVSDRWLATAILALVALCAVLARNFESLVVGATLLVGCLAILVGVVLAEAARKR